MKWTKSVPRAKGYYWNRRPDGIINLIYLERFCCRDVHIGEVSLSPGGWVNGKSVGGEWSGPVERPINNDNINKGRK